MTRGELRPGRAWLLSAVVVAAIVASAVALWLSGGARADPPEPSEDMSRLAYDMLAEAAQRWEAVEPPSGRILWIAPRDRDRAADPDVSPSALGQMTLEQVETVAEAAGRLDHDVVAIMLSAEAVEAADWSWLQDRFREHKAILVLNATLGDLVSRLSPASDAVAGGDGLGIAGTDWVPTSGASYYSLILAGTACDTAENEVYGQAEQGVVAGGVLGAIRGALSCTAPLPVPR